MTGDADKSKMGAPAEGGVVLTIEQARSRRARNIAIGLTVALLVVLFYAVTLVRLGGAVANRAI